MKLAVKWIAVLLAVAAIALLMPDGVPVAGAEASELPVYTPVTLEAAEVEPIPYDQKTPYAPHADGWLPDQAGYVDGSISVRIEQILYSDSIVWLTWVQIADASQLRAATYQPYPSTQLARGTAIAEREKAVLAINGDFFIDRKEGYILRNGKEIRVPKPDRNHGDNTEYNWNALQTLIIDKAGDFHILTSPSEAEIRAFGDDIAQSFAFGPGLIIDGEMTTEYPLQMMKPFVEARRTVFCQMDTLSYLILVASEPDASYRFTDKDGVTTTIRSTGVTLPEMTQLAYDLGAKQAYNLDGGSSSWLVLNNEKVNGKSVRHIGDIIYFVTALPEEN